MPFNPSSRAGATLAGLAALVAGCGGGGGGSTAPRGDSGVIVTPSPPPPPPATPPPSPPAAPPSVLPPAPFGITASRQFSVIGWVYRAGTPGPIAITPGLVDLRWSASAGTYEVSLPELPSGRLEYAYPGSNNRISFKLVAGGVTVPSVAVSINSGLFQNASYRSTGNLDWGRETGGRTVNNGTAAFGIASQPADIPVTGMVAYRTQEGESLARFDFAAGTFTGHVRIAWQDAWGPYPSVQYDLTQTSHARGSTGFGATFDVPGAPVDGLIRGQFMGARAQELAIAWQGPVRNPYSGEWEIASGVWLGRVCQDSGC